MRVAVARDLFGPVSRSDQLVALIAVALGACAPAAIAPPLVPGVRTGEDGGQIGTADPFVVIAADPHARWVALCQAREDTDGDGRIAAWSEDPGMGGDALKPYLVFGSGPGVAVDDYLGTDDRGEHIIFVRDGRLLVHHVSAGRTEDLSARGADARDDGSYFDEHRAASLDRARQRLVYHVPERGGRRSRVIVRDLHSGAEVKFTVPGLLFRASFLEGGDRLLLRTIIEDSDGDGRLTLPGARRPLGPRACRGRKSMHYMNRGESDWPEAFIAPVTGGPARKIAGPINPVGGQVLAREQGGAVLLPGDRFAQPEETQWLAASRDGRVLHRVNPPEPSPEPAANQERDWAAVIDLSPPRTPLPCGPLMWRVRPR